MDTNTLIRKIYQRHSEALRAVGGDTWCDLQAAQLSLHLAMTELAAQIDAAPPPAEVIFDNPFVIVMMQRIEAIDDRLAALQDEISQRNGQVKVTTGGEPWLAQSTGTLTANGEEQQALNSPATEPTPDDDLQARCIAELQRLATDGKAPTKETWDDLRNWELPASKSMLERLDMSWSDLITAAGLHRARRAKGFNKNQVTAAQLAEHVANGAELVPDDYFETSLNGKLLHEEKRVFMRTDGAEVHSTRQHIMLR